MYGNRALLKLFRERQVGFEDTILHTIYPFFEKIGVLWLTGAVKPAQEHFVSNLIRQKLIVAIDGVIVQENPRPRRFLLFLPEGEMHEMGLLFYHYLIKKAGHKAVYLGQSVPFKDIQSVVEIRKCDSILTSVSSTISGKDLPGFIKSIAKTFPQINIYLSVYEGILDEKITNPNITWIKNALHFREILKSL